MAEMSNLRPSERVISEVLDGEVVLLHLDTGKYYSLNETGTRLWELIAEHGDLARARDVLLEEYDTDSDTLTRDVEQLVSELSQRGLLVAETR